MSGVFTRLRTMWNAVPQLAGQGQTILLGFYLLALYIFCILAVVLTLAAHQMQQKAQTVQINGEAVSIWLVKKVALYLEGIQEREDSQTQEFQIRNKKNNKKLEELRDQKQKAGAEATKLKTEILDIIYKAVPAEKMTGVRDRYPQTYSTLDSQINYAMEIVEDGVALDIAKLTELRLKYSAARSKSKNADDGIRAREKILSTSLEKNPKFLVQVNLKTQIDDVKSYVEAATGYNFKDKESEFIRLHKIASEFQNLKSIEKRYLPVFKLAALQPEILTLILVLVMGGLGGLIHLTQGFLYGDRNEPVSYYIFRPILGVSAAVTIYILSKAGVLVVTDPSAKSVSSGQLSPFFISFLAIVSGLMAQNAIGNVHRAGENLFKPSNLATKGRWAFGVVSALEAIEKENGERTRKGLVDLLGESKGVVNDWIRGETETPEHAQRAISAWVNKPIHLLFHDMKTAEDDKAQNGASDGG